MCKGMKLYFHCCNQKVIIRARLCRRTKHAVGAIFAHLVFPMLFCRDHWEKLKANLHDVDDLVNDADSISLKSLCVYDEKVFYIYSELSKTRLL